MTTISCQRVIGLTCGDSRTFDKFRAVSRLTAERKSAAYSSHLLCRHLCLHFPAHAFHLAKDAQQIPAKNFVDVDCVVSAIEQRLRNLWKIGGRIYGLRGRSA